MNTYILAIVSILSLIVAVSLSHIVNEVPHLWVILLTIGGFSLGFVFGIFTDDRESV